MWGNNDERRSWEEIGLFKTNWDLPPFTVLIVDCPPIPIDPSIELISYCLNRQLKCFNPSVFLHAYQLVWYGGIPPVRSCHP
ncbi:hypothetical protein VN97_g8520 [Penicillium thymicola]|uniref:Uncharacterized protein n=1 Tax=Penicillium thymicola TaxID=293382 RepID=A0AAI9X638_PENTH|nr:hypothetical protein VN97_g8520 [Penicillium thymicola]